MDDQREPCAEWACASAASHAPSWVLRVVCECGRTYGDDGDGHPGLLEFACVCGRRAAVDMRVEA